MALFLNVSSSTISHTFKNHTGMSIYRFIIKKRMILAKKLIKENELLKAKTEALQSSKRIEELYEKAMKAMLSYRGQDDED